MSKSKFNYFYKGIELQKLTSDPSDNIEGSIWFNSSDNKLKGYISGAIREIVDTDRAQTLTNKEIVVASNTITTTAQGNLTSTELNMALDELQQDIDVRATQFDLELHTLSANNVHGITGSVVGTSDTQTVTNKTIVVASNTITTAATGNLTSTELNAALAELQTDIDTRVTGSDLFTHEGDISTHGVTGAIVGTTDVQGLSNKTISALANTISTAPSGNLTSVELNAALAELQDDIDTRVSLELTNIVSDVWGTDVPAIVLDGSTPEAEAAYGAGIVYDGNVNQGGLLLITKDTTTADGSASIFINTGYNSSTADTGGLYFYSGNQTGSAGNSGETIIATGTSANGDSGNIELLTGSANNGTRGKVIINALELDLNSKKITNLAAPTSNGNALRYDELGVANGIATLDGSGKVPLSQLPSASPLNEVTITNNQVSAANVSGFLVDSSLNRLFKTEYSIERRYEIPAGSDDTAFYTNLGTAFGGAVYTSDTQSDDKILIGGGYTTFNSNTRNRLVRLNNDGTEDASFYTNLGSGFDNAVSILGIQADGKIIVGGSFSSLDGNGREHLVRLNTDGTEDAAFYTNLGTGFNNDVNAIAIQADGKILVGGVFTQLDGNTRNRLVRLDSSGSEDGPFASNINNAFNGTVRSISIQSDNKILLVGDFTDFDGTTINRIVRLNSDGTEDTTFTTNVGTAFNTTVQFVYVQNDDKILVGGNFTSFNGTSINRLIRLNSDGTEDTTFTTNLGTAFDGIVYRINIYDNDRILVCGDFANFKSTSINKLIRLNSDGTEDTLFTSNVGTGFNGSLRLIHIQDTGKVLVGGVYTTFNSNTRNRLVRLDADGVPTELMTQGSFSGIYRPTSLEWELGGFSSAGDASDVTFSITTLGQVQYTSTNISGTEIESTMKWVTTLL
jgi:uncharacterized delta-60 repeat protein